MTLRAALFWDIDLTLLTTARAGIFALEDAVREICGIATALQDLRTAGMSRDRYFELLEWCLSRG